MLHELGGHGVLYHHVNSPNFGFAHSAGDSVAAILCDPDSQAPDRFVTFPWVDIGRRHDRTPAAGCGWGGSIALNPFGPLDGGGYNNEQILSTTHVPGLSLDRRRLDRTSARGSSPPRVTVYLILRAIGHADAGDQPVATRLASRPR